MKLTKQRLKEMIKEELASASVVYHSMRLPQIQRLLPPESKAITGLIEKPPDLSGPVHRYDDVNWENIYMAPHTKLKELVGQFTPLRAVGEQEALQWTQARERLDTPGELFVFRVPGTLADGRRAVIEYDGISQEGDESAARKAGIRTIYFYSPRPKE